MRPHPSLIYITSIAILEKSDILLKIRVEFTKEIKDE